jgi:tetratricopeptide (TPR) repeat protein
MTPMTFDISRSRGRRTVVALLIVSFAACCHAAWALPPENPGWIRLQSAHFVAYSDAGEPQARKVLVELEQFRRALSAFHPGFRVDAPRPTYVFVFHDEQAFLPYKPVVAGRPLPFAGYFLPTPDADYVTIRSGDADPLSLIRHEFVHEFLRNNLAYVPTWLNEGIAEFYRTFQANPKGADVGLPIQQHLNLLSTTGPMPLDELFRVTPASREMNEGTWQGRFYATSWALVHYLISGGKESSRKQLDALLERLQKGSSVEIESPEALEKALQAYVMRRRFQYTSIEFTTTGPVETQVDVRAMKRDEILVSLSDLLIHTNPELPAPAEEHLRAALALNPGNAPALTGLAFLLYEEDRPSEALPYIEKAAALSPEDFLVQYRYAAVLLKLPDDPSQDAAASPDETPARVVRARAALKKAIALRPGFAEPYVVLGQTYNEAPGTVVEGIAALEQARRLLPSRMDIAYDLVLLYLRNDDRAGAQALVDGVMTRSGNDAMLTAARQMLSASEQETQERDFIGVFNEAVELANHGHYKEAISLLEKTLPAIDDPEMVDRFHVFLDRLRKDADRPHKPARD